jgi:hypothetical protein
MLVTVLHNHYSALIMILAKGESEPDLAVAIHKSKFCFPLSPINMELGSGNQAQGIIHQIVFRKLCFP